MSSSQSKYRITLTICLFAVCIIAALITASFIAEDPVQSPLQTADELPFYMKASGNRILVYRESGESIYTLKTPLNLLPDRDQSDLKEGIYIPDEASLQKIIEDFEG